MGSVIKRTALLIYTVSETLIKLLRTAKSLQKARRGITYRKAHKLHRERQTAYNRGNVYSLRSAVSVRRVCRGISYGKTHKFHSERLKVHNVGNV